MDFLKNHIAQFGADTGMKIVIGLLILIVGLKVSKYIVKLIGRGRGFSRLEPSVQSFIKSFAKILLYAVVISGAAICMGFPATSFMTVFASAGVAIGLALQGALSNFAGGLLILIFKPFKVGDFVESGGVTGTVTEITVIYTIVRTVDNKMVTIPNGSLTAANVTNYTACDTRRVEIIVSASYGDDIDKVKKVLLFRMSKLRFILTR